jgi:hypothetical protein
MGDIFMSVILNKTALAREAQKRWPTDTMRKRDTSETKSDTLSDPHGTIMTGKNGFVEILKETINRSWGLFAHHASAPAA